MEVSYNGIGSVYCDAVVADNHVYLSGLISENLETGELVLGTIEEETALVLKNMAVMLERYGSGMDKLIHVDVYLADFSERDRMNEIYRKAFPADRIPTRFCCGVNGLAAGCKVEMVAHGYC